MDMRQVAADQQQQLAGAKVRPRLQYLLPVDQLPQSQLLLVKEAASGKYMYTIEEGWKQ